MAAGLAEEESADGQKEKKTPIPAPRTLLASSGAFIPNTRWNLLRCRGDGRLCALSMANTDPRRRPKTT